MNVTRDYFVCAYSNNILRVDQSWEKDEIDTYGTTNGYNFSNSNMISSNFELPSTPENFQVPQNETQLPMQAPYNQIPVNDFPNSISHF